jgi:phenylpyruvate tautomerase PptA (4-oxalocrotonate tautomerase family)
MPLVRIEMGESRITQEIVTKLITDVTEAVMGAVNDESLREYCWVVVEGVPARQWGVAGKPFADWDN